MEYHLRYATQPLHSLILARIRKETMKYFIIAILTLGLASCETEKRPVELPKNPANYDWPSWEEYCARQEYDDPACEEEDV